MLIRTAVRFNVPGRGRYVGLLNARGQVGQVQTWVDTPVLGDTLVETRFSDYKDFGGLPFPGRIVRSQGGHLVLDLQITQARRSTASAPAVPPQIAAAPPAQADAYTPLAANAPLSAAPNPYAVKLCQHIQRLQLDVAQITALHGPRVTTSADLRAAIGAPATTGDGRPWPAWGRSRGNAGPPQVSSSPSGGGRRKASAWGRS